MVPVLSFALLGAIDDVITPCHRQKPSMLAAVDDCGVGGGKATLQCQELNCERVRHYHCCHKAGVAMLEEGAIGADETLLAL